MVLLKVCSLAVYLSLCSIVLYGVGCVLRSAPCICTWPQGAGMYQALDRVKVCEYVPPLDFIYQKIAQNLTVSQRSFCTKLTPKSTADGNVRTWGKNQTPAKPYSSWCLFLGLNPNTWVFSHVSGVVRRAFDVTETSVCLRICL